MDTPLAAAAETRSRLGTPLGLLLGAVLLAVLATALLSHDARDNAFSMAGGGTLPLNRLGVFGAWISDLLLFSLGFSAWWLWLVSLRHWLRALADVWREQPRDPVPAWRLPLGVLLLLLASCTLEWTRLYALEVRLPGHAGGVLGYELGPVAMQLLGFAGSGLAAIVLLLLGMAWALSFSWLQLAERLGTWLEGLWAQRQQRREAREDERLGQQALQVREAEVEVAKVERELDAVDHEPLYVEPPVLQVPVEVPSSTRVAAERQKPLFQELADTKLPQIDLLDAAATRIETVTPESLEMTSRLIEKKLKDFGVEVRVSAAYPGPVSSPAMPCAFEKVRATKTFGIETASGIAVA